MKGKNICLHDSRTCRSTSSREIVTNFSALHPDRPVPSKTTYWDFIGILDFFLWGHLATVIFSDIRDRPVNTNDLKNKIIETNNSILHWKTVAKRKKKFLWKIRTLPGRTRRAFWTYNVKFDQSFPTCIFLFLSVVTFVMNKLLKWQFKVLNFYYKEVLN